jgi:acetyltransferase-like isoleucine patch superfamily enzyme
MDTPRIDAASSEIADDCEFGPDVEIEAKEIRIGPACRIGFSGPDDFRTPPGVRIRVDRLVLGAGVEIGRAVRLEGGQIRLDDGVRVARHTSIRVLDELHVGAFGTIGESAEISGRQIDIGQELWMLPTAKIGGGSAFERESRLTAGHFLHLGAQTLINTARPVTIGHEVGLGTRTAIFTHGAYPSGLMGFPVAFAEVSIGDFTWIPGATINPGVHIGRNCVIGVNSLVTTDIPDGALAAGSPAKVIREAAYPRPLDTEARATFWEGFLGNYARLLGRGDIRFDGGTGVLEDGTTRYVTLAQGGGALPALPIDTRVLAVGEFDDAPSPAGWTLFDTRARRVRGVADEASARLANELRRHGIRFYSRPDAGRYADWAASVPAFDRVVDSAS